MNRSKPNLILAGLLATAINAGIAHAAGAADQITVNDAYIRQAPPGAMATGAFMVIRNAGPDEVRVVKAASTVSRFTELHTHLNEGGVMKMRQVKDIPVPPGGEAVLKPGGLHVMLIEMRLSLREGDMVPITLGLDDGSSKVISVPVRNPSSSAGSMGGMVGHKH
ncbi:MAG: copper chaperone PCu(A)C [Pseudomonadota bacterium]